VRDFLTPEPGAATATAEIRKADVPWLQPTSPIQQKLAQPVFSVGLVICSKRAHNVVLRQVDACDGSVTAPETPRQSFAILHDSPIVGTFTVGGDPTA
jgi:hypothetical protein